MSGVSDQSPPRQRDGNGGSSGQPHPDSPGTGAVTGARLPIGNDLELLLQAAKAVLTMRTIGPGTLQRRIRVGFVKAGRLLLLLEQEGIITQVGLSRFNLTAPNRSLDDVLIQIRATAETEG